MAQQVILPGSNVLSKNSYVVDGTLGGQQGAMNNPLNWESSMYHTKQKLIAVLIQAPRGFKYLPNGDYLKRLLKAAIETHCTAINGLNQTTTMEVEETVQGYGGEVMQTPTLVTRARSEPAITIPELEGKPFTKLFRTIQTKLVMEPGTTHPGVVAEAAWQDAGSPPLTPADRSFITLFIEPNRTLTGVESAYLCANMMPLEVPEEITKEVGTANEITQLEVTFTAFTLTNDLVKQMAKEYLDSINKNGYAPDALTPFVSEIEPALRNDALSNIGNSYAKYLEATAAANAAN
jgi:hypothetical protein